MTMKEQPKNFGFGEDETMLKDSAAKFFSDNCSPDKLHSLVAEDPNIHRDIKCVWNKDLWQQIAELGWTAACVPEAAGGLGMPLVAAVAIAEEAGKAAFPSPLISTMIASFVLRECQSDVATAALGDIASGVPMTLAVTNKHGSWEARDTDVAATNTSTGTTLNGTSYYVQDAQKCDHFVVSATTSKGIALYLVDANAAGVSITADGIIDLTRDQAHIEFKNAAAIELAAPGTGDSSLAAALPAIQTIITADMVGAGEWLLQTTVEYASTRVQFDHPLGFFQAVKHPLVNVMLEIDRCKSLAYNAACAIDVAETQADRDDAAKFAHMAKANAGEMAIFSSSRAVQFHGGIGFTWECYIHLFFKRQMHNQMLFGDAKYHRAKLADILIGAAA
ncbi:MAG: alkylation response protein AidB-like acyl-CoA dehydrogenase [Candidatus Azotimanducaceae bacterium]|jgi:alkylation response protein AidB-like acyl-CoA dehydrogenase